MPRLSPAGTHERELVGIHALLAALTVREGEAPQEDSRTADLVREVALDLQLDAEVVTRAVQATMVRHVGRIGIPDTVLLKREPLDFEERTLMRQHAVIGAQIVSAVPEISHLATIVRAIHERWDGTGYPDCLSDEEIPTESRVIHVCAAYTAMISDRPYRQALSHAEAGEVLARNSGSQFWPPAVDALLAREQPGAPAAEQIAPAAPVPPPAPPARPARPQAPTPRARGGAPLVHAIALAVGLPIGLIFALPLKDVDGRCPPAGEGLQQCIVQKAWLPAIMTVLLTLVVVLVLTEFVAYRLPGLVRRVQAGPVIPEAPPFEDDPVLRAANWGLVYEPASSTHRFAPPQRRHWQREE